MKKTIFPPLIVVLLCLFFSSCDDKYGNQLRDLGTRVEILEDSILEINKQTKALHVLVVAIENNGYITEFTDNGDGTYTLTLNDGSSVTLRSGKDGQDANMLISVKKYEEDGLYYWWIYQNGKWDWARDDDNNMIRAGSQDGKDGITPQMRINNGVWEISIDGGQNWKSTGVSANGKDGKDGREDKFKSIVLSDDGSYITITMQDGTSFNIPIKNIS